ARPIVAAVPVVRVVEDEGGVRPLFLDREDEPRDRPLEGELPVDVAVRVGLEVRHGRSILVPRARYRQALNCMFNACSVHETSTIVPVMSERAEDLLARVGSRIRSRRRDLGLSRKELGERAGLSERFLTLVEAGSGNPSLRSLAEIAGAL